MSQQIKTLEKNCYKYKLLWEADAEAAKIIMAEMENEIKQYVEALKKINASDNSQYNAKIAHKVLKEFGKL
jgi:G:T-mismatch repair DNA endonuclease (very short patch repair protein)